MNDIKNRFKIINEDYCDGEEYNWKGFIATQPLKNGYSDMTQINIVCQHIRDFVEIVISEWKTLLTNGRNTKDLNSLICKAPRVILNEKDFGSNDFGCRPIVHFQPHLRKFIPQLTHIVQDFGVFFPLGYRNIEHVQSGEKYTVDKYNKKISDLESKAKTEKWFPDQLFRKKRQASVGWEVDDTIIFLKSYGFKQPKTENFINDIKRVFAKSLGFSNIPPNNSKYAYNLRNKVDTIYKLRYIDNNFCNKISTTNNSWKEHDKVLNEIVNKFNNAIDTENSIRGTKQPKLKITKISILTL